MTDLLVRALGFTGLTLHGDPLAADRIAWIGRTLPASLHGKRVLDAGCGNGTCAILAARRGATVVGVSDSERELADAQRRARLLGVPNVKFKAHDLRSLPNSPDLQNFDFVLCLEVIEHVLDDVALLASLADRATSRGQLLLTTPTDDHPPIYGEERHLSGVEDGRHVRWGSSAERLVDVCRAGGWAPDGLPEPLSGPVSRRLTSASYRLGESAPRAAWLATLPLRPLVVLDPPMLRRRAPSHCWGMTARRS